MERDVPTAVFDSERCVFGLVLAAGLSSRMGVAKPLLPLGGRPLVEHVLGAALASRLAAVYMVASREVAAGLAMGLAKGSLLLNERPERGQSYSLQMGLSRLPPDATGCMVLMADQPGVTRRLIDRLVEEFETGECDAVVPLYAGERGSPVILGRSFWPAVMRLSGDVGAKRLLAQHPQSVRLVEVGHLGDHTDLDTPEEYERFRRAWQE